MTRRPALTLLEVVVALAIFSISILAIFQLVGMGTDRAVEVQLQTRTSLRCQAKMAEAVIGAQELTGTGDYQNFTDADKDLQWKLEAETMDENAMLYTVKVWVKGELPGGRVIESYLCQMVLNPKNRGTTFDPPVPPNTGAVTPTP